MAWCVYSSTFSFIRSVRWTHGGLNNISVYKARKQLQHHQEWKENRAPPWNVYLGELTMWGYYTLNKSEGSNYWMLSVFTELCLYMLRKYILRKLSWNKCMPISTENGHPENVRGKILHEHEVDSHLSKSKKKK